MENKNDKYKFITQLEKRAKYKLIKRYDKPLSFHDVKMINDILYNQKTRYVEMFKEYLLYEDYNEFLKKFYDKNIIKFKLPKILQFYEKFSKIYANYTVIPESKYMYKNIKRKQKVLDQINNNYYKDKKYSEDEEDENSSNEYYSNTIFNKDILNSIYNKSNYSKNTLFNITNSTNTINDFINKITDLEKEKEKEIKKKKIDKKTNNSKTLSNILLNKNNKKIKQDNNNKKGNLNSDNFNNFKKGNMKCNSNFNNNIQNNPNNIEINNNSNNIIIYNYNYNMNENMNNLNSLSNNTVLQNTNNNSGNLNKANINFIYDKNNYKNQKINKNNHIRSNIVKQKIISTLIRPTNDFKKIDRISNIPNKNSFSNYFYYFNNKSPKHKVYLRDNFSKKRENFILSTNYLNSSKSLNSRFLSSPCLRNNNRNFSSKPKSSKNSKYNYNLSGNFSNINLKKKKYIKTPKFDQYSSNNDLLKYSKKISKTTKNKKTNKMQNIQKDKNIKNKNPKRPESHRDYHNSKILSSDISEKKFAIKKFNTKTNNNKKNKEEKNIINSDFYLKDKRIDYNGLASPYTGNSFFSYSHLNSPTNSWKNEPIKWSFKDINIIKKDKYNNSKDRKNISVSKSKKSTTNINKNKIDKAFLILSEKQNKNKIFKNFFKNKTEKELLNKMNETKSYIIENNMNNKIIIKDNSFNKIAISQATNDTPTKIKFNNIIKKKCKEKNNTIKNYKINNNNYTLFNKIKQPQKVIIKTGNIKNNFNKAINEHNNKIYFLSERNKNKNIFSKK